MHPQSELACLAARKRALRERIQTHRASCAAAVTVVTRPLRWLDQLLAVWRGLAPVALAAAVPLGLLMHQNMAPRLKNLRNNLENWAPLALSLIRGLCGKAS